MKRTLLRKYTVIFIPSNLFNPQIKLSLYLSVSKRKAMYISKDRIYLEICRNVTSFMYENCPSVF